MKKIVLVALCLFIAVSGISAMERTFGFGVLYNAGFTRWNNVSADFSGGPFEYDATLSRNGFGAFGFLGVSQFWEFNLGFLFKNPSTVTVHEDGMTFTENISDYLDGTVALQFGVYFKYPFPVSDTLVVFPTIGTDFELSFNDDWWHDLWIRAGVGVDRFLNDTMFLRAHVIYGVAIPLGSDISQELLGGPYDGRLTHGLLLRVGLGWMR